MDTQFIGAKEMTDEEVLREARIAYDKLGRLISKLEMKTWKQGTAPAALTGGFYEVEEGREASAKAVLFGELLHPPIEGATVKVRLEEQAYFLSPDGLARPHGQEYEAQGKIKVLCVSKFFPTLGRSEVVIIPSSDLAVGIRKFEEANKPVPRSAKKKRAR